MDAQKRYTVIILRPESVGQGCDPLEKHSGVELLPRDEGHFGLMLFKDAEGLEHMISIAWPFRVYEDPPAAGGDTEAGGK